MMDVTQITGGVEMMQMRDFFDQLTDEQKAAALAYRGDENHGDPAFARVAGNTHEIEVFDQSPTPGWVLWCLATAETLPALWEAMPAVGLPARVTHQGQVVEQWP